MFFIYFFIVCAWLLALTEAVKGRQKTIFPMDVVASAYHMVVDADSTGNSGRLTFGTYRKSTGASVPPRDFTVRLYESGATVQGCSAFKAGQVATLDFGNPGQLDAGGVVTRGAGEGIRVDAQADYRGRLTQDSHSVNYPVEFAAKGQFRFRAQPVFPANVKAGEYRGALTFVVTYQLFLPVPQVLQVKNWICPLSREAGKQILDVTPQDSNELCLTEAWLAKTGIYVSADYFREGYDATRQCYVLTKVPSVKEDFDVTTQSLVLSIPLKGLVKMPENVDWDYGNSAFRVNYNANANTSRNNTLAFGSADLKANIGHWVVSSSATASGGDSLQGGIRWHGVYHGETGSAG